uniref:Structure-specific endonuclease subunit SLX4 n=1 Tax=Cacopsylla melanoneura TaxID=428564 RepID=A0A8D8X9X2_9HEMI
MKDNSNIWKVNHLKQCASKHKVTTQNLLRALKLQIKQDEEREALGLPKMKTDKPASSSRRPTANPLVKQMSSKDPSIQLAMALSASLQEAQEAAIIEETSNLFDAGLETEALECAKTLGKLPLCQFLKPGITTKDKKLKSTSVPVLLSRSKEERDRIVSDRVANFVLVQEELFLPPLPSESYQIKSKPLRKYVVPNAPSWELNQIETSDDSKHYTATYLQYGSPEKILTSRSNKENISSREQQYSQEEQRILHELESLFNDLKSKQIVVPNEQSSSASSRNSCSTLKRENLVKDMGKENIALSHREKLQMKELKLLSRNLGAMIGKQSLSDITIYTKEELAIPCHKLILMSRIPAMMKEVIRETDNSGKMSEMLMWNMEKKLCLTVLKYVYSGVIDFDAIRNLDDCQTDELKQFCETFQIQVLCKELEINKARNFNQPIDEKSEHFEEASDMNTEDTAKEKSLSRWLNKLKSRDMNTWRSNFRTRFNKIERSIKFDDNNVAGNKSNEDQMDVDSEPNDAINSNRAKSIYNGSTDGDCDQTKSKKDSEHESESAEENCERHRNETISAHSESGTSSVSDWFKEKSKNVNKAEAHSVLEEKRIVYADKFDNTEKSESDDDKALFVKSGGQPNVKPKVSDHYDSDIYDQETLPSFKTSDSETIANSDTEVRLSLKTKSIYEKNTFCYTSDKFSTSPVNKITLSQQTVCGSPELFSESDADEDNDKNALNILRSKTTTQSNLNKLINMMEEDIEPVCASSQNGEDAKKRKRDLSLSPLDTLKRSKQTSTVNNANPSYSKQVNKTSNTYSKQDEHIFSANNLTRKNNHSIPCVAGNTMKPVKTATRNLAIDFDKIEVDTSAPPQANKSLNLTVENLMLFNEINELSNEPRSSFFDKETMVARTENKEQSPRASSHGSSLFFEHLFNEKYGSGTKPTKKKDMSPDKLNNIITRRPTQTKVRTKINQKDAPQSKPGRKKVPTPDFLKAKFEEAIIEIKSSGSESLTSYPTKALSQSYQFYKKLKKHTPPKRQTKSLTQPQRKVTPRSSIQLYRKRGPRNSNSNTNLFETDSSDEISMIAKRKPSLVLSPIPRVSLLGVASSVTQTTLDPIEKPSQLCISPSKGASRIPSAFHRIGTDHSEKPSHSMANFSPTSSEMSKDIIKLKTRIDGIVNSTSNSNSLKDDLISNSSNESDRPLARRRVNNDTKKPSGKSTTHNLGSVSRTLENPVIPNTSRRRKSSNSDTSADELNSSRPKVRGPRHSISSSGSLFEDIDCPERFVSSVMKTNPQLNSPQSKTQSSDQKSTCSTGVIPVLSPARDHESFHTATSSSSHREPSPVIEMVLSPQFFSPPMYIWDDPGYEDNMIPPNEDVIIPKPAPSHSDTNIPNSAAGYNENTEDAKEQNLGSKSSWLASANSNSHISVYSLRLSDMEQQNAITAFHEKLSNLSQPLENSQFLKRCNEYFGCKSSNSQINEPVTQATVVDKTKSPATTPRSSQGSNTTAVLQNMHLLPDVIINQPEGAMDDSSSESVWGKRSQYYQQSNRIYSDKPISLHSEEETEESVPSKKTVPNLRDKKSKAVTDSSDLEFNQTVIIQPNSPKKLLLMKQIKGKEGKKYASISSPESETYVNVKTNSFSHSLPPCEALSNTIKHTRDDGNETFTETSRTKITKKTSKYLNMSPSNSDKESRSPLLQTYSSDESDTNEYKNSLTERKKLELTNKPWLRAKTTKNNLMHDISNSSFSDSERPRAIKNNEKQNSSLSATDSDNDRQHNEKTKSPRAKGVSCSQPASFNVSHSIRQSEFRYLEERLRKTKTRQKGHELEETRIEENVLSFPTNTPISSHNADTARALTQLNPNPESEPTLLNVRKSLNFDHLLEDSLGINESYLSRLETQHGSTRTSNATRSPTYTRTALTTTSTSAAPTTVMRTPAIAARSTVLDTSGVTPLADYSVMETPLLKKELNKYGLKPNLGKSKAKLLLRYIYNQTHPYVDSMEETSENTSNPQPKRRKTNQTSSKISDNIPPGRKTKTSSGRQLEHVDNLPPVNKLNPRSNEAGSSSRVLPVSKGGDSDRLSKVRLEEAKETLRRRGVESPVPSSDECNSSDSESSVTSMTAPCVYEESILFEHNINTSSPPSSQTTGGQNFLAEVDRILRSPDNYKKILRYEPIWLEHLHNNLKQRGVRCNVKQLMDYLDEKCITFRTIRQKPRVRQKPAKSNKRRTVESEGGVAGPSTSRARQYSSQPVTSSRRGR